MDLSVRRALAHSEKCGTAFDWSVDYWHEYYTGGPAKEPVGAERLRVFGDALRAVGARGQWLDAGCGIGEMARHFRRAGLGVCGIDTSAALIEEAQRVTGLPLVASSRAADSAEHLCRSAVERTPYADARFDGVYSSSVLEYVANLELALAELGRVVRKNGNLVFNLPNGRSIFRRWHALRHWRHPYYGLAPRRPYSRDEIRRLLERTGWLLEGFSYYGIESNAPGLPAFLPASARRRLAGEPWAASFVLIVARKR